MAKKTPAEKMHCKPGLSVALLHAPEGMREALGFPENAIYTDDPGSAAFILAFATTQAEAEATLTDLAPHVRDTTLTWVAYPKGSRVAGRNVSRDTVWRFAPSVGLTLVANVAIDETWSALRLKPDTERR